MLTANDCLPGVWVRVSGGRLCEAEALTETATVWLPKGLLQAKNDQRADLYTETVFCIFNL